MQDNVIDAHNVGCVVIVGRRNSAKTALGYALITGSKRDKYWYCHPNPKINDVLGIKRMYDFSTLNRIQDSVIVIDEPDLYFEKDEIEQSMGNMIQLSRQRGNTLVLITSNTRFVTKALEEKIDVWLIKDIEMDLVKQGSMIKKIIKRNIPIKPDEMSLNKDEFIFHSRDFRSLNGVKTFEKPTFFTDEYSKPYRNAKKVEKKLEDDYVTIGESK